jgi:hypothetical protein
MIDVNLMGKSTNLRNDTFVINKIISLFDSGTLKFKSYDFESVFDNAWRVDPTVHCYHLMVLEQYYEFELHTMNKSKIVVTVSESKIHIEVVDG